MESLDRSSEAEWIHRAQNGDKEAFGQVVKKYMRRQSVSVDPEV
jgi:hypothetical protein